MLREDAARRRRENERERPRSGVEPRRYLDSLYIQKTREVVSSIRKLHAGPKQGMDFTANLNAAVMKHGANRKVDSQ